MLNCEKCGVDITCRTKFNNARYCLECAFKAQLAAKRRYNRKYYPRMKHVAAMQEAELVEVWQR